MAPEHGAARRPARPVAAQERAALWRPDHELLDWLQPLARDSGATAGVRDLPPDRNGRGDASPAMAAQCAGLPARRACPCGADERRRGTELEPLHLPPHLPAARRRRLGLAARAPR